MLYDTSPFFKSITKRVLQLLLIFLCTSQLALAEKTRWYDVEVILFKQTSQQYLKSETWPGEVTLTEMDTARSLRSPAPGKLVAFSALPSSVLRLGAQASRIQSAPDLKLIKHFGWRQPGLSKRDAVSVKVFAGSGASRLEGTLKLILSRYLHIQTDLRYRDADEGPVYYMQQSRRMRSNELHYLDNPAMGMIVRVRPVR